MKGNIIVIFLLLIVMVYGLSAIPAFAGMPSINFNIWEGTGQGGTTCNESSYSTGGSSVGCSVCDAVIVASNIVNNLAVPFGIIIAVVFIVYGAIRMMVSFGSESNFAAARGIITSALIGLAIILCGWIIVNTVFHLLTGRIDFPWAQIQC